MHPILHVIVVGFHHRRGGEIEYCYPPLAGDNVSHDPEKNVPVEWANLPTLAMPDGAHNVEQDVIYFVLPSLENPNRSVFGISCYRQISTDELKRKDSDVTRSTVQKSVCVLSSVPLYGVLKYKLELITQAYFNERDFSKVEVLRHMHTNLCDLFDENYLDAQTFYTGISLTPLFATFGHRVVELFKLLLLEQKVVFDVFPASLLGDLMVGLISLFPALLEEGLFEASHYSVGKAKPVPAKRKSSDIVQPTDVVLVLDDHPEDSARCAPTMEIEEEASSIPNASNAHNPSSFNTNEYGFPLSLFTKGALFHPYLSISYLDVIRADTTRAFCVGVTNALFSSFKHRRELIDVIVTAGTRGEAQIEILNNDLKRQISLTTQDRRFAEVILKTMEERQDSAIYEGSDDWVRSEFQSYLISLFVTTKSNNERSIAEFGSDFVNAWKTTLNYRIWCASPNPGIVDVDPIHPYTGQTNVNDLLVRMGRSEQGRKMISTLNSTGRYVSETGSKFRSSLWTWNRNSVASNSPVSDDPLQKPSQQNT